MNTGVLYRKFKRRQKQRNNTARAIVAHLGWRWLAARRSVREVWSLPRLSQSVVFMSQAAETEAWNAFESARRILYGDEP